MSFDPWAGDAEARTLRAALEAGDLESVVAAYGAADASRREFFVQVLTEGSTVAALESWPSRRPGSAEAYLLRGAQRTTWAWQARGRGDTESVEANAWDDFFNRLRSAEADLLRAVELADDGVAWSRLLITGRGLEVPLDELRARYARATDASADLTFAADQLLQSLCEKWLGSHEEMFAFARATVASVSDGDPRLRLIPLAHLERVFAFGDDFLGGSRYRAEPGVHSELIAAAERSVFRFDHRVSPQHRITLNAFAMAFCHFGRFDAARPLLDWIGSSPTLEPWASFGDRAGSMVQECRGRAGLPALPG